MKKLLVVLSRLVLLSACATSGIAPSKDDNLGSDG